MIYLPSADELRNGGIVTVLLGMAGGGLRWAVKEFENSKRVQDAKTVAREDRLTAREVRIADSLEAANAKLLSQLLALQAELRIAHESRERDSQKLQDELRLEREARKLDALQIKVLTAKVESMETEIARLTRRLEEKERGSV